MSLWSRLKKPPFRTILLLGGVLTVIAMGYLVWSPGKRIRDGRHDHRTNGIWLQHGWLGDDSWFERNQRDKNLFRNDQKIQDLAGILSAHGIKYVFPHLCPCESDGTIAPVNAIQTERFLSHFEDFEVIPWIGGVLDSNCHPQLASWRSEFVRSSVALLEAHPRFAGVQINIEPLPSGNRDFLTLLDELNQAMPTGKIVSVAAYPPPTRWHPFPDVHWDEPYFREVASRVDLIAPMMYDTAIKQSKFYCHLMARWTKDVLNWSGDTAVLLGLPAYDDTGVGYHSPKVENLKNSLLGIHAGLSRTKHHDNYLGIAIYSEWEMDQQEWDELSTEFEVRR